MRRTPFLFILFIVFTFHAAGQQHTKQPPLAGHVTSRAPLRQNPYVELPLGAIKPQGWLGEMLLRQKAGSTGHLDGLYPLVMGGAMAAWAVMATCGSVALIG